MDPYAAPPIKWTFQDSSLLNPKPFDEKTLSHMPKCDASAQLPGACVGSGTYVHLGLELVQKNIGTYKAECAVDGYLYPCSDATEYINIIVTDGDYQSTDAQVKAPLETMFTAGITSYVIGFGDLVMNANSVIKLDNMAKWGSGGANKAFKAAEQADLEAALKTIIEKLSFDPCCKFNDCSFNVEPTTINPDPEPLDTTGTSSSSTTIADTSTSTTTDATTTDATTTDATTGNPLTSSTGGTTADPTTGGTDPTTSATGTGTSDSAGTTTPDPTSGGTPATSASDTDTDGGSSSGSSGGTDGGAGEEGCGCKVEDENNTRGLLGTLFGLGLAGFIRRRRRA
jgi:MYXO-CTERM domain-containing protein